MTRRLTYPFAPPAPEAVEISAQDLARMAEDAGCTVEELQASLAADPITRAELVEAAGVAKRARQGTEPLTLLKL